MGNFSLLSGGSQRILAAMTEMTQKTEIPPDIAALSFEEAMAELEKLVRALEDGRSKLEDAILSYERGALLKQHCQAKLRDAEMRIEQMTLGENGPQTEPFNAERLS